MERKTSLLPHAGMGLFATKDIRKDELVTYIKHPKEVDELKLDTLVNDDSAICVFITKRINGKNKKVKIWMTDKKNVKTQDWFYQNHQSQDATTFMRLIKLPMKTTPTEEHPKKTKTKTTKKNINNIIIVYTIGWFAKRNIKSGEELCFNYDPGTKIKY